MMKIKYSKLFSIGCGLLMTCNLAACTTTSNSPKTVTNISPSRQFDSYQVSLDDYPIERKNQAQLLPKLVYNNLIDKLNTNSNTLAIALIYNNTAYLQQMIVKSAQSVWDYLRTELKQVVFKFFDDALMGIWLGPFYFKDQPQTLIHGTMQNSNYDMVGYPLLFYNHNYASNGAASYIPEAGQIIEVTYNHGS